MNAVDTNILVYCLDRRDLAKRARSRELLQQLASDATPTILLWQVVGEFMRQLRSWQDREATSRTKSQRSIAVLRTVFPLTVPTERVIDLSLDLAGRYSLSHWDSMLLGACKDAGVRTLYTEDMGSPTQFDEVRLINPFK